MLPNWGAHNADFAPGSAKWQSAEKKKPAGDSAGFFAFDDK
jgi:hypothetical protein